MNLRQRHFIDSHKCATLPATLAMIAFYGAWENPTAWVYLGLHGSYGLMWALKSRFFGDPQWEKPTTLAYGVQIWAALTLYWSAPWLITAYDVRAPGWLLGAAIVTWALGVFLHFTSDMQKHVHLRLARGSLLRDGLWARCRNPNYLGELLIYAGFGALAMHWLPLMWLAVMVVGLWLPNMRRKDASLARYPEFAAWRARSCLFIPYLL